MDIQDWIFVGFLVFIWATLAILILINRPPKKN